MCCRDKGQCSGELQCGWMGGSSGGVDLSPLHLFVEQLPWDLVQMFFVPAAGVPFSPRTSNSAA